MAELVEQLGKNYGGAVRHTFAIGTHRPSHGAPTQAARRTAIFEGSGDG